MSKEAEKLLAKVREHYETSHDFNGLSLHSVDPSLEEVIKELIRSGDVDLVRGDRHPNPHIKALPAEPIDMQIRKIEEEGLGGGCLYPTSRHLERFRSQLSQDAPFTRELELGSPQLDFRVFDLRVVEWYRNDPRYFFEIDDIHGRIHRRTDATLTDGGIVQDKLDFFEFGFAYNHQFERALASFLRYLHDLPPEQQRYLANFQLQGTYKLHPDFYRTQIIGDFPERVSIYDAFLAEKRIINEMCQKMGKPPLFRTPKTATERPLGFAILIRPTRKEFRDFALLLDQLLSDDLNHAFFKNDIPVSEVLTREDGSTVEKSIGTITLLKSWFKKHFQPEQPLVMDQLFKNLRDVREARQKPAHKADDNHFDQAYVKAQRELINKAFNVVRTIRMALENHPSVRGYTVPVWLEEARVWDR